MEPVPRKRAGSVLEQSEVFASHLYLLLYAALTCLQITSGQAYLLSQNKVKPSIAVLAYTFPQLTPEKKGIDR